MSRLVAIDVLQQADTKAGRRNAFAIGGVDDIGITAIAVVTVATRNGNAGCDVGLYLANAARLRPS